MWELNYKESWAPKNWCFWTVVLEKTPESPLNCKEIQPVHPKDQSWIFIGRTDAEAETSIIWPRDAKTWLTGKDPAAAAAAKSLQSCPTLCNPIDGSPPGSLVPGILQTRTLEWVAISFSNAWKWKVKVKSLSCVWILATPWAAAYQAPPSMGFSKQEYWSGVPLPYLLENIKSRRRRGWQRIGWLDGITDMSLSKFQKMVKDREASCATVHGVAKSRTWLRGWTTARSYYHPAFGKTNSKWSQLRGKHK